MATQEPTNQDVLNAITELAKTVNGLKETVNQTALELASLTPIVGQIAIDVTTLKEDVTTLKSDVSTLKSEMTEVKDEQERQGKKLDQLASFTNLTSGAFVA